MNKRGHRYTFFVGSRQHARCENQWPSFHLPGSGHFDLNFSCLFSFKRREDPLPFAGERTSPLVAFVSAQDFLRPLTYLCGILMMGKAHSAILKPAFSHCLKEKGKLA